MQPQPAVRPLLSLLLIWAARIEEILDDHGVAVERSKHHRRTTFGIRDIDRSPAHYQASHLIELTQIRGLHECPLLRLELHLRLGGHRKTDGHQHSDEPDSIFIRCTIAEIQYERAVDLWTGEFTDNIRDER